MTRFTSLLADTRGVTALEYALIAAIVGVVTVGAMHGVGNSLLHNFAVLVEVARETPEPMAIAEARRPAPPTPEAPAPAGTSVSDLDDDESAAPSPAAVGAPEPDDVATGEETLPFDPDTAASDPALGSGERASPTTAPIAPPESESASRGRPDAKRPEPHGDNGGVSAAPKGGDAPEASVGYSSEADGEQASPAAVSDAPARPVFTDRQKAAIRSGFILFLWAALAICLANLIWRIVTRKAHKREVEDQLEGWQPASFG